MPRPSMAALITQVRLLIADPAGSGQAFSDDEIQTALDRYQTVVRYAPLHPEPTLLPTGVAEYRDYFANRGDWEADEQLVDASWNTLTPATSDRQTGHWTFASPGQNPPVYIVGKTYDLYAAAADLLEAWAAKLKLEYDFSTDGQSFQRSLKVKAMLLLAREYRRLQLPTIVRAGRSDVNADSD